MVYPLTNRKQSRLLFPEHYEPSYGEDPAYKVPLVRRETSLASRRRSATGWLRLSPRRGEVEDADADGLRRSEALCLRFRSIVDAQIDLYGPFLIYPVIGI